MLQNITYNLLTKFCYHVKNISLYLTGWQPSPRVSISSATKEEKDGGYALYSSHLQIRQLQLKDEGFYKCIVKVPGRNPGYNETYVFVHGQSFR